jgi:structural maintenance of chromosome 4
MSAKAEQLRSKVSNSRSKADEARASLAADKSENAVLGSLNKLKAQGRIKGFHVSHAVWRRLTSRADWATSG